MWDGVLNSVVTCVHLLILSCRHYLFVLVVHGICLTITNHSCFGPSVLKEPSSDTGGNSVFCLGVRFH
jgi:hypothetical protein